MRTKEEIFISNGLHWISGLSDGAKENIIKAMNEYAIEVLNNLDEDLRNIMRKGSKERGMTEQQGVDIWDKTTWHKKIMRHIDKLKEDNPKILKDA